MFLSRAIVACALLAVSATMARAEAMDDSTGRCPTQKPMADVAASPSWESWGINLSNTRFQPRAMAGLSEKDLPRLKLKWAFGFPGSSHAWSQPIVAGGRVFVGSQGGHVYALDAKTGCTTWSFDAGGATRTAIVIGDWRGHIGGHLAYFTTIPGWLFALDAETGAQVWKARVEDHVSTRLTGSPVVHGGRLYVPAASFEEGMSANPKYTCCSFRGSLSAFDALTGERLWKSMTIEAPLAVLKRNDSGQEAVGPSGGSIWSSPVIDSKRKAIYVTTGNGFSGPAQTTTDAIAALDLDTGKLRWSRQVARDIFVPGCNGAGDGKIACPEQNGPDADFGSAPILVHLKNRDLI